MGDQAATNLFLGQASVGKNGRVYSCSVATLPVQVMLTIRGGITDTGVVSLRLPIDETTPGNLNPVVPGVSVISPGPTRLLDNAGTVIVPRDQKVRVRAGVGQEQAEVYLDRQLNADGEYARDDAGQYVLGPTMESLTLSWFSEGGGFVKQHTLWTPDDLDSDGQPAALDTVIENDWTTPTTSDYAGTPSLVLVVVRDSRGGVAWTQGVASLEVTP